MWAKFTFICWALSPFTGGFSLIVWLIGTALWIGFMKLAEKSNSNKPEVQDWMEIARVKREANRIANIENTRKLAEKHEKTNSDKNKGKPKLEKIDSGLGNASRPEKPNSDDSAKTQRTKYEQSNSTKAINTPISKQVEKVPGKASQSGKSDASDVDKMRAERFDRLIGNKNGNSQSKVYRPAEIDTNDVRSILYVDRLQSLGINSLWYMAHVANIPGIISKGILSHEAANNNAIVKIDISDPGAQQWRDKKDPFYYRRIHEYAPLYVSVRNPMLYVRRDINQSLCLIEIDLRVIHDNICIFSDGNAASRSTKFYDKYSDEDFLSWDVLNAEFWSNVPDGKRKKCAEVLVYPSVNPAYFKKFHFFSAYARSAFINSGFETEISPKLFF